jgi:hypothetical protein
MLQPPLHLGRHLGPHGRRRIGHHVQQEERKQRTEVQAEEGGEQTPEQVEVRIGDGEDRLQDGHALRLREPRQKDAGRNDEVVNGQKGPKATHEHCREVEERGGQHKAQRNTRRRFFRPRQLGQSMIATGYCRGTLHIEPDPPCSATP